MSEQINQEKLQNLDADSPAAAPQPTGIYLPFDVTQNIIKELQEAPAKHVFNTISALQQARHVAIN